MERMSAYMVVVAAQVYQREREREERGEDEGGEVGRGERESQRGSQRDTVSGRVHTWKSACRWCERCARGWEGEREAGPPR